jgi:hypothetical protein
MRCAGRGERLKQRVLTVIISLSLHDLGLTALRAYGRIRVVNRCIILDLEQARVHGIIDQAKPERWLGARGNDGNGDGDAR